MKRIRRCKAFVSEEAIQELYTPTESVRVKSVRPRSRDSNIYDIHVTT